MLALHHVAMCTTDLHRSIEFWCGGMGLTVFFDQEFSGEWPALFDAPSRELRSMFLGDPVAPEAGIVELLQFEEWTPLRGAPSDRITGSFCCRSSAMLTRPSRPFAALASPKMHVGSTCRAR